MNQKLLAVTVGTGKDGQPSEPIIFSIEQERPDYIVFFVTEKSNDLTIPKILEILHLEEEFFEKCFCPDENDVIECYRTVRDRIQNVIYQKKVDPQNIVIDFTTGTKAMSSALVLAGMSLSVGFLSYVTGPRENGITVTSEKALKIKPTEIYWERIHKQTIDNFNAYRFDECIHLANELLEMSGESEKKNRGKFLEILAESYKAWDLFDIKKAFEGLCSIKDPEIMKKYRCKEVIEKNKQFLSREINHGEYSIEKALDLYTNAQRRYSEGKYDDAVARLYRLLEYIEQVKLYNEYDIDTSNIEFIRIPEKCSSIFPDKKPLDKINIDLSKGYDLLNCLEDPIGAYFMNINKDMKKILHVRNTSILAHGFKPIGQEKSKEMFKLIEPLFENFIEEPISKFTGMQFPRLVYRN